MITLFFIKKTRLILIKIWYFRTLAPMETKSPELIKVIFLAPKKRLKEALFGA
jgi:hypothetical protein